MIIKKNKDGILMSFTVGTIKVYLFSSVTDSYRGGKQRTKKKNVFLLFGKAYSKLYIDGKHKEIEHRHGSFFGVPKDTPHLMRFKSYSWVIEWWNKEYQEEKYEPYYTEKENARNQ